MTTVREFCERHNACQKARRWAAETGWIDRPMADLWASDELRYEWRLWALTRPGVASDRDLRLFACRCVRETPLTDGRRVWDLLTDERSRSAVVVAERYERGGATRDELAAAWAAARDAAGAAARAAAWDDAWDAADAACDAARAASLAAAGAARDAAWAAAGDAQSGWMREISMSFGEGKP